jgi:lipopolysaccharide export system protein LptA
LLLAIATTTSAAQITGPIQVLDAEAAEYDGATGTWLWQGNPVRVRRGDLEIAAGRIVYREREQLAIATGGVRARHRGQEASADRARLDMAQETIALEGNVVLQHETAEGTAVLRAPTADMDMRGRRALARDGVHVTWGQVQLRSETVSIDLAAQTVLAEGGPVAVFEGVRVEAQRMQADLMPRLLRATGGVRAADSRIIATAHGMEVRWAERVATLHGDVVARRGHDVLRAAAVRYDFASGRLIATGRPQVAVHP